MARKYANAAAFERALSTRLLALARETGINYGRLRREIANDRFLARLQAAAPGEWLLKGGVALDLRFARGEARRTKDVDLETRLPATLQDATLLLAAEGIAVPGDTLEAHALVAALLDPVLANRVDEHWYWNPQNQRWEDAGR